MSHHDPNAAFQQAMTLQRTGDAAGAAAIYRRLLQSAPANALLLLQLGTAEMQLGHFEDAIALLRRSLRASPNQFRALGNLGLALKEAGRPEEALVSFDRAVALNPGYAIAHNNRGAVLLALGRFDEALDSFQRALAIQPGYAEAHNNRGGVLRQTGALEAALAAFDQALAAAPNFASAHLNRGLVLNDLWRPDEALISFERALALDDRLAATHCGRASALFSLKRIDEAQASNARALALEPGFAEAQWNCALFSLIKGDLLTGWEFFEARWNLEDWRRVPYADSRRKLWLGEESVAGKTVLVRSEQGYGDVIQFCRYAPMLHALGAKVVLEAKARLLPLLRTLDRDIAVVETGSALPAFDYFCPVMSLPKAFQTTLETIPAPIPYLFADPHKQSLCEERLGAKTAPRIGLVWSGNPNQPANRVRSVPLADLQPLLELPFAFHALQKEFAPGDEALMARTHIVRHDAEQNDFADAAALIACMDLVVTVDSVLANLAGAMGKPVWILLPWMADWRWLLEGSSTAWYPSATLFRQSKRGDWHETIAALAAQLRDRDFASA